MIHVAAGYLTLIQSHGQMLVTGYSVTITNTNEVTVYDLQNDRSQ